MKNDSIKLTIVKWREFNPPSDFVRHPHWFRINQNIITSMSLFGMNPQQKWVWICILTECSRKNSDTINVKITYIASISGTSTRTVVQAIETLKENGSLSVDCQLTDSSLTTHNTTLQTNTTNITKHICPVFDFEKVFEKYPKRPNQNKERAFKTLQSTVNTELDLELCVKAAIHYQRYVTHQKVEQQFIKQFSTWSNQWREWIVEAEMTKSAGDLWLEKMLAKEKQEQEGISV